MTDGQRMERSALPLMEAAARLGMSAEALRKRVERGEARGFDRNGEFFVYVGESPAERRFGGGSAEAALAAPGALPVVVEFQKMELDRLLRENERLNARLDRLMDEIRHLRDMQQREQALREQDQGLRRQIQDTLDHLANRLALPPPHPAEPAGATPADVGPADVGPARGLVLGSAHGAVPAARPKAGSLGDPRPELVLTRTVIAKNTAKPTPAGHGQRPGDSGTGLAISNKGQWRREPHTIMPKPVPERPAAANPLPAPASVENGGIAPEEAAELAEILTDIGRSLHDSEAFRRYPPVSLAVAPQRAGDRRSADRSLAGVAPSRSSPDHTGPDALPAEERAKLEIGDATAPSADQRRATAGRIRRLLRGRLPPRRQEP